MFKFGPDTRLTRLMVRLSWPLIKAGKKLSAVPVFKTLINPFFACPLNEVTAVPIGYRMESPDPVVLPCRVVERLVAAVPDVFIMSACMCRTLCQCSDYLQDIGCMALGSPVSRMHPSHGHRATSSEAVRHDRRAARAGLVADVTHTWIDAVAFGLIPFNKLMFICFCDDCCCIFRTHMRRRGPNLDRAYKRLPGISVAVDPERCDGCGLCVQRCFVGAMVLRGGRVQVGDSCKGCGRCAEICPRQAVSLTLENEDALVRRLLERIRAVADIQAEEPT